MLTATRLTSVIHYIILSNILFICFLSLVSEEGLSKLALMEFDYKINILVSIKINLIQFTFSSCINNMQYHFRVILCLFQYVTI